MTPATCAGCVLEGRPAGPRRSGRHRRTRPAGPSGHARSLRAGSAVSADGATHTGFHAGDGITHLLTDRTRVPGHYELVQARITDGPVQVAGAVPLTLPDGSRPSTWARRRICRDNRMWLQFDDPRTWYVTEI